MNSYFTVVSGRPDRAGYSDTEWRLCRLLTEAGIRGRFLALDELEALRREAPDRKNIQTGGAALEALCTAIGRPVVRRTFQRAYDPDETPDRRLFQALAEQCSEDALHYFVRHHDSGADCSILWNKLMELGETIHPGKPLPEQVTHLLLKSGVFLCERFIYPTGFRLLHETLPDFRVEQACADALLGTAIFLKYRAKALGGASPRCIDLIECWKALSPEPPCLAPLDEFAGHIHDDSFVSELRAALS